VPGRARASGEDEWSTMMGRIKDKVWKITNLLDYLITLRSFLFLQRPKSSNLTNKIKEVVGATLTKKRSHDMHNDKNHTNGGKMIYDRSMN
jgi:hypothetical protein